MTIEIRHLEMIRAIEDEGSMTRAAERLNVTQSALSHQLREIEDRLRLALFHRVGRRLVLTDAGRRLLATSRSVLAEIERAEADLAAAAAGRQGVIRVATECYTCYRWLPAVMRSFQQAWPAVEVQIAPDFTHRPLRALRDGEIDLAVAVSPAPDADLLATPILRDEVVLATSPDHAWASRASVDAGDVAREHLLLHTPASDSWFVRDILAPARIRPRAMSELKLTEAIVDMVAAGMGVSPLANWLVADEVARRRIAAVRVGDGYFREWFAVTLASADRAPYLDAFVDTLQRHAAGFLGVPLTRQPRAAAAACRTSASRSRPSPRRGSRGA